MDLILDGIFGALSPLMIITYIMLVLLAIAGIIIAIVRRVRNKASSKDETTQKPRNNIVHKFKRVSITGIRLNFFNNL